ncbi:MULTISPECIES: hypothetical protein [unclassified Planococcus (in: firmicutes)]|nr:MULTISPECIES: hypothetical protein [unclassified Planococcus (in: firmicutes)]
MLLLVKLIGAAIAAVVFESFFYVQEETGIEVVGDSEGKKLIK